MSNRMTALATFWSATALIVWNTCVLFILLNCILGIAFYTKKQYTPNTNEIFKKYPQQVSKLLALYPTLSPQQVNDLLLETWWRPNIFEPFTDLAEAPFEGHYVNVSSNGYRLGLNQGPWPPRRGQDFVVFLFGGSTTFSYGVPDDQTLGSVLQEVLSRRLTRDVKVYNFGRAYYYSTQERILFEKLLSSDYVPDLAIFVDGINDFYFTTKEPEWTPAFAPGGVLKNLYPLLRQLPLFRLVAYSRITPFLSAIVPKPATAPQTENMTFNQPELLMKVIQRYLRNKSMIEGIVEQFGPRVLFVWQPTPLYRYNLSYHLFNGPFGEQTFGKYGYPLMRQIVDKRPLSNFKWCADIQEDIKEPLYVDEMHYAPRLIGILAECIAQGILQGDPGGPRD